MGGGGISMYDTVAEFTPHTYRSGVACADPFLRYWNTDTFRSGATMDVSGGPEPRNPGLPNYSLHEQQQ